MTSAAVAARGIRAGGAGRAGAASTAWRSAGGTLRSPELDSGAGRAFQLHSFTEAAAQPWSVPRLRLHTRKVLHGWGLAALADTAELLVSELVTNAIRASQQAGLAGIRLLLMPAGAGVRIQVWDGSPGQPARQQDQPADAESGRGLVLVELLSRASGSYRAAGGGKIVWCVSAAGSPPGRS
jgi:anti-sigma regulatory factor (Ser/Thr protein kinase)